MGRERKEEEGEKKEGEGGEGGEGGKGGKGGREVREERGEKERGGRRERKRVSNNTTTVAASQAYSLLFPIWELPPHPAMVAPKIFILHVHTSDQKKVIMYHFLTVLLQLLTLCMLSQVWWCYVVKYFCAHYR